MDRNETSIMRKSTDKDNFGFAGDLPLRSGLLLTGDSSYIRIGERFSPYSNITLQKTEIASTFIAFSDFQRCQKQNNTDDGVGLIQPRQSRRYWQMRGVS
jgi:hypothetical protein